MRPISDGFWPINPVAIPASIWFRYEVNTQTWEDVACAVQMETGMDTAPMDAFDLATVCGLKLIPVPGSRASLSPDDKIRYPSNARPVRQHGLIAHEVGHWALHWQDEEDSEQGASWVAGALMLPRRCFDKDLSATKWDLRELKATTTSLPK